MKIDVSELEGGDLDNLVARCDGWHHGELSTERRLAVWKRGAEWVFQYDYHPSTSWEQAGPIIERERIDLRWSYPDWVATAVNSARKMHTALGPTPLIAAMRAFVASKTGNPD